MEGSPITRGSGTLRKTIDETVKKELDFNILNINMIYGMTL